RHQLLVAYQFERRRYNEDFRERDSGTHQAEIFWGAPRGRRRPALEFRGFYRLSDARASDGDEAPGAPADDADLSYQGFGGGASARAEFARRGAWRLGGEVGYDIATRHYDSSRPFDRYHFGRNDLLNAIEIALRAHYRPHWAARCFYRYEVND